MKPKESLPLTEFINSSGQSSLCHMCYIEIGLISRKGSSIFYSYCAKVLACGEEKEGLLTGHAHTT